MSRRALGAAAALSLLAGGCAHSLAAPAARPGGPLPAPGAFAVRGGRLHHAPPNALDPLAVLEARLLARGASEVVRTDEAVPSHATIELFLVGERATPLTRWTAFPSGLAMLATLGLVPAREAHEHVVELHAIFPSAPPGRRVRIARRSFVQVAWVWLPLAFARGSGQRKDARSVREEGFARAIDAALDEVLDPGPPGPIAGEGAARR